eukprot:gene6498-11955_t
MRLTAALLSLQFIAQAKVFRKNKSYLYGYEGIIENGIKGASENTTQMRLSADLHIDHVAGCQYSMQMKNVKLEESFGSKSQFTLSAGSISASQALERFPVRFVVDHGIITDVQPVLKERERNLLNIKRGILSSFQVKWSKRKSVREVDVSGECSVTYKLKKEKDGTKNVTKQKNLTSCERRSMAHSNIDTSQYKEMSSIYEGKSTCAYFLGKKNEIKNVMCTEFYLMRPFSTSFGAGAFTNIRSYFFEALSQCGSTACVNVIGGLIISQKIPRERVDDFISALNFIQEPSPSMLNTVMGIYKSTQNPNALLLVGTLMHKMCSHRPSECQGKGLIGGVIQEAEYFLIRLLGNDCRKKDEQRNEIIYYSLKAIGNAGRPLQMKDVIIDCVRHSTEPRISVAALHALRKMPLGGKIADQLRMLLIDRNVDLEKRIESFLLLLEEPSEDDILLSIDMVNDEREAHQIRSFISSYLKSLQKNSNPLKSRVTNLLKESLEKKKMVELYSPPSRFSKAFDRSFYIGQADVGGGVHGYTIFHPESFIPRSARFGLGAQVLGHSVDAFSVTVRMEGLERYVEKIVGDTGYFSKQHLKTFFDIPMDLAQKKKTGSRKKRNVGRESFWNILKTLEKQVNMKESAPQLDLTFSIFGSDVRILKLKDIHLLNGELEDFNVVRALYSLTKGKKMTLRRSFVFLEGSYVVPTALGLPLNFGVNGSAIMSLHLDGKVGVNNLVLGPKNMNMKGSVLPSVSLAISGKVTVDGFFSKVGLRLHSNTHTTAKIGGEVDYKEGKIFEAKIDAPSDKVDLFKYKHEIFHVLGQKEIRFTGLQRRTNLNLCADEVYNSSEYFGVDVCSEFSFPVAYQSLSAPYYPLTGPANVGFTLHKRDKSLSFFHFKIASKKDFLQAIFGTPGAKNPRMNKMNLAIMPSGNKGIVGATFGNTNRGLLLKYRYDNISRGLEAELTSNITKSPVVLATRYFNETNPLTLDIKMGIEIQLVSGNSVTKTFLHFTDTYSYWGFKWLFEHQKARMDAELKVAYNPQTIFMSWNYGDKKFALQLVPSFPIFSIDLLVNWQPKYANLTLKGDVNKGRLEIVANTTTYSFGAMASLNRYQGYNELLLSMRSGLDVYTWLTKLDYENSNKIVQSQVIFKGKKYGITSQLRRREIVITVDGMQAYCHIGAVQTFHKKGLNLTWNIGGRSGHFLVYFNTNGHREVCAETNVGNQFSFSCLRFVEAGPTRFIEISGKNSESRFMAVLSNTRKTQLIGSKQNLNIFTLKAKINDESIFDSKIVLESDLKTKQERLSRVNVSLVRNSYALDLKVPSSDIFRREVTSSGWLKLSQKTSQGTNLAKFDIRHIWNATLNTSDIFSEAKFIRHNEKDTGILAYLERVVRNGNGELIQVKREFLSVWGKTVRLVEGELTFGHKDGKKIKWETKYKSGNTTSQELGELLINGVRREFKSVKPSVRVFGEVKKTSGIANDFFYPSELEVAAFKNRVFCRIDLEKGFAKLNSTFPHFAMSLEVLFKSRERYVIALRYMNSSLAMEQLLAVVTKSDINNSWEVEVSYPKIKHIIRTLKSVYRSGYQDYEAKLLAAFTNESENLQLSVKSKSKLLVHIADLTRSLLLSNNASKSIDALPLKWKRFMGVIWDQITLQAVRGLASRSSWTELEVSQLKKDLDNVIMNLVRGNADVFRHLSSLNVLPAVQAGNQAVKMFQNSLKKLVESTEVQASIFKGIEKALVMLNFSKEVQGMVRSRLKHAKDSNAKSPVNTFILYRNISNVLINAIIKEKAAFTLKYLRSKLKETFPPKIQTEVLQRLKDTERILELQKTKGTLTITDTIKQLQELQNLIHQLVIDIVKEEMRILKLPKPMERAILQFTKKFGFNELYSNVLIYVSDTLNLTRKYPDLAQQIMTNDTRSLLVIGAQIFNDMEVHEVVRKKFAKYLKFINRSELVKDLLNVSLSREGFQVETFEGLLNLLDPRNRTNTNSKGSAEAFSTEISAVLNVLFADLAFQPGNVSLLHSILRLAHKTQNTTRDWVHTLKDVSSTNYFDTVFKEVLKELKSSAVIRKFINRLEKDGNIPRALKEIVKQFQLFKNNSVNGNRKQNAFALAKSSFLKLLYSTALQIPYPWQSRFQPILGGVVNAVKEIKEEDLIHNTTKVLFDIGESLWQPVFKYVTQNLTTDVAKDLEAAFHVLAPRISFGNISMSEAAKRISEQLRARLRFVLRVAAQVFPDLVSQFERTYLKDGNFSAKLYQDFLATNLTEPSYLNRTKAAIEKLTRKILMEVQNATNGFSSGTAVLNLLKFVNGLNLTSLNSASKSFDKMKGMKYSNWSLPDLLDNWKEILKTMGRLQIGNQTVNKRLQPMILDFKDILPHLVQKTEYIAKKIEILLDNSTNEVKRLKLMLHEVLSNTAAKMKYGFSNWPKLLNFLSDLLVPVIGTTRNMLGVAFKKHTSSVHGTSFANLNTLWMRFDRVDFTAELVKVIESASGTPIEQSFQTLLKKGAAVFDEIENYVLKQLQVYKETVHEAQSELQSLLKKASRFLTAKAGYPLHKFVHKSTKHIYNFLNGTLYNSSFYKNLQAEVKTFNEVKVILKKLDSVLRNTSHVVGRALSYLHPHATKQWAQTAIPGLVQNGSIALTNGVIKILTLLEKGRKAVVRIPFLKDPAGFLYRLPKNVFLKLQESISAVQPVIYKWISDAERMTKESIFGRGSMSYRLRSDVKDTILKLNKLWHYMSALDVIEKQNRGDGKTYKASMNSLKKMIDVLTKHSSFGNRSAASRDCHQLQKFRISCLLQKQELLAEKGWVNIKALLLRIAEGEGNYFNFEKEMIKNITSSIHLAKELARNVSEKIKQTITSAKGEFLLLKANETIKDISKVLESMATFFNQHVRVKSSSDSVLFVVPEIQRFEEIIGRLIKIKVKNSARGAQGAHSHVNRHRLLMPQPTVSGLPSASVHLPSDKTTAGKIPLLAVNQQLGRVVEMSLAMLRQAFDNGREGLDNAVTAYQAFTNSIDSRFDLLAKQTYNTTLMQPLRWLSKVATIPVPGEKLQSFFKTENMLVDAKRVLAPLQESATFYDNHVFTFDGGYLYLPRVRGNGRCMYLLARDFRGGAFTILYKRDQLLMYIGQTTITFSRFGKVVISSLHDGRVVSTSDLPMATTDVFVESHGTTFRVTSRLGLQISCNKDHFMCSFTISGMYHNKTLGLFGTNNVEYADDLRLPNGKISIDVVSFVNSWEVSGCPQCQALERADLLPKCIAQPTQVCRRLFNNRSTSLSR